MKIRKANLGDVPKIISLWKKLESYHNQFKSTKAWRKLSPSSEKVFEKFLRKNIRSPDGFVLVAEDKNKIIAYSLNIIKKEIPIRKIKRFGYISDLYVEPKWRGKGVTSKFKAEVFKWFKSKGIKDAAIAVHPQNKRAYDIYRKWGFVEVYVEMRRKIKQP